MKTASVKEIRQELNNRSSQEVLALTLRLASFKKENKELLTYLLFEADDELAYVEGIKREMDELFEQINTRNYYLIRKGVRKILLNVNKYIRYSKKKETEVALLIYFCSKLKRFTPSYTRSTRLRNLYTRQVDKIKKSVSSLHEDLQFDFEEEINELI